MGEKWLVYAVFENSYLQKQMKLLTESEELLTNNLTGEEKKAFLSFANASNIIHNRATEIVNKELIFV